MTRIMVLGTFHMGGSSYDMVNGDYPVREKDIKMLVESLSKFKPNKIAVEFK